MTETSEGSEKSELEEKVSEETSKSEMPPPSTCKVLKSTKSRLVPKYPCTGCGKPFNRLMKLKYHIRSAHFNLKSVVPTLETKHVNDIWYESVINTNDVVEMRKESDTKIIIKKCITNEPISTSTSYIDVSNLYPTNNAVDKIECKQCHQMVRRRGFKNHFRRKHSDKTVEVE